MDSMVHIDVQVDDVAIQAKLQQLIQDDTVKAEANQALADIVYPYVPYDTGALADTAQVSSEGVTYIVPYASKNYYGDDIRHKTDKHPLATAHWDEVAMQTQKEVLENRVKDALVRKAKGNG